MTPDRELLDKLQMVAAGYRIADVLKAVGNLMASTIGLAANDLAHADRLADTIPADLKRIVRDNWNYLRELRAGNRESGAA